MSPTQRSIVLVVIELTTHNVSVHGHDPHARKGARDDDDDDDDDNDNDNNNNDNAHGLKGHSMQHAITKHDARAW